MTEQPVVTIPWDDAPAVQLSGGPDAVHIVQMSVVLQAAQLAGEVTASAGASTDVPTLRAAVVDLGNAVFWLSEELTNLIAGVRDGRIAVGPTEDLS